MSPTRGDFTVELDPGDLRQLLADVKAFDKTLATATRKRLREAAGPVVADVRHRLLSGGYKRDRGLTRGIAAGTKVSIRTGIRNSGIAITTTGAKLPAAKRAMVKAFNLPSFRHPVFPDSDGPTVWTTQKGRPYFGAVIYERRESMQQAVEKAMSDAAATIRAGQVTT